MTAPDREKALQLALAQIEKNHGIGELRGRLEDAGEQLESFGVVPDPAESRGDQRSIVRPDTSNVIAHRIIGDLVIRESSDPPAVEHSR